MIFCRNVQREILDPNLNSYICSQNGRTKQSNNRRLAQGLKFKSKINTMNFDEPSRVNTHTHTHTHILRIGLYGTYNK